MEARIMETNIKTLVTLCDQEISSREYAFNHHRQINIAWDELLQWMEINNHPLFNADIGCRYCIEMFGSTVISGIKKSDQPRLRAIRMLISYQQDGDFEFRTPTVLREFQGETGTHMERYLNYLRETILLTENTISNKKHYLLTLNVYLEERQLGFDNLSIEEVTDFYAKQDYTLASKHNCNSALRLFFRHIFEIGLTARDCSDNILPDNYNKKSKLPTTYTEEEIRRIINAVERSSSIGKRDYLILLLASEFGWRSSDIVNFCFDQIDWDNNTISFCQQKTGVPVVYPLLSSIGNAIIDYLKYGRPKTDANEIIVSGEKGNIGKKLSAPTIHSIVTKYMKIADINNWAKKKHGPHSLRHSLVVNLLKKNISISIISNVLGHQSTQSTKTYISLDNKRLKECALPIPCLKTSAYEV
jgi:site-specific recombinase XerD